MSWGTFLFAIVGSGVIAAFVLGLILIASFANATYSPAKSVITLSGVGSAPSCPSGWTEIVAQTAAGTMSPVTSISTTGISPITSVGTTAVKVDTEESAREVCPSNGGCSAPGSMNVLSSANSTGYTVAAGGSATTYTYYYRVCER
jgi:hypothetical protein